MLQIAAYQMQLTSYLSPTAIQLIYLSILLLSAESVRDGNDAITTMTS